MMHRLSDCAARSAQRSWPSTHGRRARGFTLLELMLVLTILGILMLLSIGAYLRYATRAQLSELMLAASACRMPVHEGYYLLMPQAGHWGCEGSDRSTYVASVAVDANGKVSVVARGFNDPDLDGQVLTYVPLIDGAPATLPDDFGHRITDWRCGSSADGTTIPSHYLPSSCK